MFGSPGQGSYWTTAAFTNGSPSRTASSAASEPSSGRRSSSAPPSAAQRAGREQRPLRLQLAEVGAVGVDVLQHVLERLPVADDRDRVHAAVYRARSRRPLPGEDPHHDDVDVAVAAARGVAAAPRAGTRASRRGGWRARGRRACAARPGERGASRTRATPTRSATASPPVAATPLRRGPEVEAESLTFRAGLSRPWSPPAPRRRPSSCAVMPSTEPRWSRTRARR